MNKRPTLLELMPRRTQVEPKKFTLDIVDRCTAEINQAHVAYAGDADKPKNNISYGKHANIGDDALCRIHSLGCKGRINNIWVSWSSYLTSTFLNTVFLSRKRPGLGVTNAEIFSNLRFLRRFEFFSPNCATK